MNTFGAGTGTHKVGKDDSTKEKEIETSKGKNLVSKSKRWNPSNNCQKDHFRDHTGLYYTSSQNLRYKHTWKEGESKSLLRDDFVKFDQCRHRYTAYQISNWNKQQQPDYILTLIRFNKSQISGSQEGIIYTFIIIAQLAKPPQFTGQNLAMLFIAAKRYNLKYSDWKHKEQII